MSENSNVIPLEFIQCYTFSVAKFNIRFSSYMLKISECLANIVRLLENSCTEVEETVLERESRIAAEFSKRFSRNNLYFIQLKMNKIEKAVMLFVSNKTCKIAQALILQSMILSFLKKFFDSLQLYVNYLRKSKIKIIVKLNEIINCILHFDETIKNIVDGNDIQIHNVENICVVILKFIHSQNTLMVVPETTKKIVRKRNPKLSKNGTIKHAVIVNHRNSVCRKISRKPEKLQKKVSFCSTDQLNIVPVRPTGIQSTNFEFKPCLKNIYYTKIISTTEDSTDCPNKESMHVQETNNAQILHLKTSNVCSRICDEILTKLISEVSKDILEGLQKLAVDTFNMEFYSGNVSIDCSAYYYQEDQRTKK